MACGGWPAISRPARRIEPRRGDAVHQGGLARAVGPEQAGDLAFARGEGDALQRLDLAVGGDDALDLEHQAVPR
jgi:hypothetical protein